MSNCTKFKVGDIVKYVDHVKKDFGTTYSEEDKAYIGNIGRVVKVSTSRGGWFETYAIGEIEELPFYAWFEVNQLELVESAETNEELLKRIKND